MQPNLIKTEIQMDGWIRLRKDFVSINNPLAKAFRPCDAIRVQRLINAFSVAPTQTTIR